MELEKLLEAIIDMSKMVCTQDEMEAVDGCFHLVKLNFKDRPDLMRVCEAADHALHTRQMDIMYSDKTQW